MPHVGTFGNPLDWNTHVQIRASQEIAMAFCNVKDAQGGQLGNTVDEMAQRCVNSEAGSKKWQRIVDDLQDQVDSLTKLIRDGGPGKGNRGG